MREDCTHNSAHMGGPLAPHSLNGPNARIGLFLVFKIGLIDSLVALGVSF
jgi:hypothetical protein